MQKDKKISNEEPGIVFFTICSWNFLAYAITLRESLIKTNGYVDFYTAICDVKDGFDYLSLPFPLILLEDLGIPSLDEMTHKYNISELNTAIKPFVFQYLFGKHPESVVIYMDPDILVESRLEELYTALKEGADCVLTPHILEPNEFATFDDRNMLLYGISNLGFCALRPTPEVQRVVSWWGRRLEQYCLIDLANGLFVDQKWADLLPAFIEKTRLLHHCGYNVAYWNLTQRKVWKTDDGWSVNNKPLRFFHFSGNIIGDTAIFSHRSRNFGISLGDAKLLFESYVKQVEFNGHHYYHSIPYGFNWNGSSGVNLHAFQTEQPASNSLSDIRPSQINKWTTPHIPIMRARSFSEFSRWKMLMNNTLAQREQAEGKAIPETESDFYLSGHCIICGKQSSFHGSYVYSVRQLQDGRRVPNWREHLDCPHCGFINRIRAFLHIFIQEARPAKNDPIYITEQITRTYSWLSKHFLSLVGSEYLDEHLASGTIVDQKLHEDLQNLSFKNESFKFILSLDVMEHVPDYLKALKEIYRCLKPGGLFLFSAPFCVEQYENKTLAKVDQNGKIVYLITPEYHGNPVDPEKGSLCFRYFGWELIDDLLRVGFETAECWLYWSSQNLYFGEPQLVISAQKSK